MPGRFVHNFTHNYCMKPVEGSYKVDLYSSRDGGRKVPKTIIFRVRGPNIKFGKISRNLLFCQILANFALLFYIL